MKHNEIVKRKTDLEALLKHPAQLKDKGVEKSLREELARVNSFLTGVANCLQGK